LIKTEIGIFVIKIKLLMQQVASKKGQPQQKINGASKKHAVLISEHFGSSLDVILCTCSHQNIKTDLKYSLLKEQQTRDWPK